MATHALAVLANSPEGATSALIAGSVNTHAVFLRKVLRQLVDAGFVEAREGRGGRYWLSHPPHRIRLSDVYEVIEPDGPLSPSEAEPCAACPVGGGMRKAFRQIADSAREGLLKQLRKRTVADLLRTALEPVEG